MGVKELKLRGTCTELAWMSPDCLEHLPKRKKKIQPLGSAHIHRRNCSEVLLQTLPCCPLPFATEAQKNNSSWAFAFWTWGLHSLAKIQVKSWWNCLQLTSVTNKRALSVEQEMVDGQAKRLKFHDLKNNNKRIVAVKWRVESIWRKFGMRESCERRGNMFEGLTTSRPTCCVCKLVGALVVNMLS